MTGGRPILAGNDAPPPDGRASSVASCILSLAKARPVLARIAAGGRSADWVEDLLGALAIVEADEAFLRGLGPIGGRDRMIGEPPTLYWPRDAWMPLAELILDLETNPERALRREVSTTALGEGTLTLSADPADPDLVSASISFTLADERPHWALRESEERYRTLIHHLPWPLVLVDSTAMLPIFEHLRQAGVTDIAPHFDADPALPFRSRNIVRVTDANRNAVDLFGADDARQLVGPVDYLFAASPDSAKRVITAHFDGRRNHSEIMKLRTFDGRVRDVQLSVTYPTPPERLDVTLLMFEDVTERLSNEAQLRQLQADYSRAARIATLGELASSIAHEVNQPLSAIAMNGETSLRWLAREDPDLGKVRLLTGRIVDSARTASEIVQRIRAMAAPHLPAPVPLDLNSVVQEALLFVQHEIATRPVTLDLGLGCDLPRLLGDRVQLQQVVVNLLINSLQAMAQAHAADERIELATGMQEDSQIFFSIRDTGPGIGAEDLARIFDGFFTTKNDGMGIGLAVCQSIINGHGGQISASNHPDGGAVFRFSLPAIAG